MASGRINSKNIKKKQQGEFTLLFLLHTSFFVLILKLQRKIVRSLTYLSHI